MYDMSVTSVDTFPHNIDQNFSINVKHPEIKTHHLYAIYILQVKCPVTTESQKIYIYPGFTTKLDHRLKETLFHVMDFKVTNYNTKVVLRFYRDARDCTFIMEYSAAGAENLHFEDPGDLMLVYTTKIILFRPAKLKLSIIAEDGHQGGLSIGKKGEILCRAVDGFPFYAPILTIEKEIATIEEPVNVNDSVSLRVIAALKDHGTNVKCTSGSVVVSSRINVFHHATSVEITPHNQQWFRQGSKIECKSVGGGFPTPIVQWNVHGLNETTINYFTMWSSPQTVSRVQISSITPNDTRWSLRCSSVNIIPPLDRGGPSMVINITIGDNVAGSIMMANYVWIIVLVSILLLIVIVVAIVCVSSHIRQCARLTSNNADGPIVAEMVPSSAPFLDRSLSAQQCYLKVPLSDVTQTAADHHQQISSGDKEQDCFV